MLFQNRENISKKGKTNKSVLPLNKVYDLKKKGAFHFKLWVGGIRSIFFLILLYIYIYFYVYILHILYIHIYIHIYILI